MVIYYSPYQTCVRASYLRDMHRQLDMIKQHSFASEEQRRLSPELYPEPPLTHQAAERAQLNAEIDCATAG